jgi:ribonucleotide monophosphatase NagD (HAD superfamily)
LKGGKMIDGAISAVNKLINNKIPFIFVSNGGGVHENFKAHDLSNKLGVNISADQIVLSHSTQTIVR